MDEATLGIKIREPFTKFYMLITSHFANGTLKGSMDNLHKELEDCEKGVFNVLDKYFLEFDKKYQKKFNKGYNPNL